MSKRKRTNFDLSSGDRELLIGRVRELIGADSHAEALEYGLKCAIDLNHLLEERRDEIVQQRESLEYHRINVRTQLKRDPDR